MFWEILNIVLLLPLLYYGWQQQQRIENLELMVGYTLSLIDNDEEDDDVSCDQ